MTKTNRKSLSPTQTALAGKAMIPYHVSLTKTEMKPIELHPVEKERRTEEFLLMAHKETYSIHGVWNEDDAEIINILLMAPNRKEALARAIAIRAKLLDALMWKRTEYGEIKWNDDEKDFEPDQL
ncbi:hypothetical protein ABIE26_000191 [Pedobacter africanus]|uniref:Uncharacterized protein n=1 Tax=Pedobacter africanus TaxID=151894 RepID=A0ACC6KVQ5_9SPHI|nr:hypothetical protein [Pedobacter africanus]MDR6783321.1 hypothetical protein [Pedobacter africanus]